MPLSRAPATIDLSVLPNGYKVNGVTHFYQDTPPTANARNDQWTKGTDGSLWLWKTGILSAAGGGATISRWVSDRTSEVVFNAHNVSVTNPGGYTPFVYFKPDEVCDIQLLRMGSCAMVSAGTSTTNYWNLSLERNQTDGTTTTLATASANNLVSGRWKRYDTLLNLQLAEVANPTVVLNSRWTKVGAPSNLQFGMVVSYKWIHPLT